VHASTTLNQFPVLHIVVLAFCCIATVTPVGTLASVHMSPHHSNGKAAIGFFRALIRLFVGPAAHQVQILVSQTVAQAPSGIAFAQIGRLSCRCIRTTARLGETNWRTRSGYAAGGQAMERIARSPRVPMSSGRVTLVLVERTLRPSIAPAALRGPVGLGGSGPWMARGRASRVERSHFPPPSIRYLIREQQRDRCS
jgi:hypothetical protein